MSTRSSGEPQKPARRVRFERHPSQVVFDPTFSSFVVTWSKCGLPDEKRLEARKDPLTWLPSVAAIAALYDRGCVPQNQIVYAAMAVGRAWESGDRDGLDTEGAKKAAELVHDLAYMCVDVTSQAVARDVGQAMRHLLDEMAKVRFMNLKADDFADENVMPSLEKAAGECFSAEGFPTWSQSSMRRRFLFCLNKKERTELAYTLVSLIFDSGSCPLLSLSDRRILRMQSAKHSGMDRGAFSEQSFSEFFSYALNAMRDAKSDGRDSLGLGMARNDFVNSVLGASSC